MTTLSGFMIATVMTSLLVVCFGLFIAEGYNNYGNSDYNDTQLEGFDKIELLHDNTQALKNNVTTVKTDPGVFDLLGSMFNAGYQSLVTAWTSFDASSQ